MLQESNRIEFKVELNDKLEKEVVAFLNNKEGGILYVGVDDNGKPVRISDIDSTQLKIADRIKNNILLNRPPEVRPKNLTIGGRFSYGKI